jgi:hypothetical protein
MIINLDVSEKLGEIFFYPVVLFFLNKELMHIV